MNMLRAEIARITHRRITKAAIVMAVVGVSIAGIVTYMTHTSTAPDIALAESLAAQNSADCLTSYATNNYGLSQSEIDQACVSDPAWFVTDKNFHLQSMLSGNGSEPFAQVQATTAARYDYPELGAQSAAYGLSNTLAGAGIVLTLAAAVLGASYVGADWRSGVMESQLVRQPNRLKLFGAKFIAIAIATGLGAALAAAATLLATIPSAIWRGDAANTGADFWIAAAQMIGRIGFAAALFAVIAAAVAMAARNTAAGVGVGLVAFIVGGVVGGLGGSWTRFVDVPQNLRAWIAQADVGYWFSRSTPGGGTETWQLLGHGWFAAGLLIAAAAVAVSALSGGSFIRRDVS